MLIRSRPRATAFSLIELVVVTGVVAVAAAITIPAIVSVRARVGDLGCVNNMRQLLVALEMYNNDHNGSMPYGFYWVNSDPVTWQQIGTSDEFVSWPTELNRYVGTGSDLAAAFRCPTALAQAPPHLLSYVMNFIVAVTPLYELNIGGTPPNAQLRPPKVHLMRREGTALIWDTGIRPDWDDEFGHLTGADIDDQQFWQGARTPQYRYFSPHDPFGTIPPNLFGNNRPIRLSVGSHVFFNKDPDIVSIERWPYQGNLRFRHNGQTQCNVAFSDGSVRQFTAVINPNNTVASHDAIRRLFMIDWPPGVTPNPSVPSLQGPPASLPDPARPRRPIPPRNGLPPAGP